jgi:hypothetical protein
VPACLPLDDNIRPQDIIGKESPSKKTPRKTLIESNDMQCTTAIENAKREYRDVDI